MQLGKEGEKLLLNPIKESDVPYSKLCLMFIQWFQSIIISTLPAEQIAKLQHWSIEIQKYPNQSKIIPTPNSAYNLGGPIRNHNRLALFWSTQMASFFFTNCGNCQKALFPIEIQKEQDKNTWLMQPPPPPSFSSFSSSCRKGKQLGISGTVSSHLIATPDRHVFWILIVSISKPRCIQGYRHFQTSLFLPSAEARDCFKNFFN